MTAELNALLQAFDGAIQKKKKGKLDKAEIQKIYEAASELFKDNRFVGDDDLIKVRDKWVELAEGTIDRSRAMKKLQGTSRAEAIRSVLEQIL